jgi:hypothetical protein
VIADPRELLGKFDIRELDEKATILLVQINRHRSEAPKQFIAYCAALPNPPRMAKLHANCYVRQFGIGKSLLPKIRPYMRLPQGYMLILVLPCRA